MRRVSCFLWVVAALACGPGPSGGAVDESSETEATGEALDGTEGTEPEPPVDYCDPDPELGTAPIRETPNQWQLGGLDCSETYYYEGVGDVDGDGVLDLLAHGIYIESCPGQDEPGICSFRAQECLVNLEGETLWSRDLPAESDPWGLRLSAGGDVDGDGRWDFAAQAMEFDSFVDRWFLGSAELASADFLHAPSVMDWAPPRFVQNFSGSGRAELLTRESGTLTVWGTLDGLNFEPVSQVLGGLPGWKDLYAPAGDVDGDGLGDIVVAGRHGGGMVLFGGPTLNVDVMDLEADRFNAFSAPGVLLVAGAGDVNHDGFDDLLVVSGGDDEPSDVYFIFGTPRLGLSTLGQAEQGIGGYVVRGDEEILQAVAIGDFNGDQHDDVALESSDNLYLIYGHSRSFSDDFDALRRGCGYGRVFDDRYSNPSWVGDLDLDGRDDLGLGGGVLLTTQVFGGF